MRKELKPIIVGILLLGLSLSGCTTKKEPDFGMRLQNQGIAMQEIGNQWSEGQTLIEEGKDLYDEGKEEIEEGQSLISSGQEKVKEGGELITKGRLLKMKSEESYNSKIKNHSTQESVTK